MPFLEEMASLGIAGTGEGQGRIESEPAGIQCGSQCRHLFLAGSQVRLQPLPAAGWVFAGWGGDAACADGVVEMDGEHFCRARFVAAGSGGGAPTPVPALSVLGIGLLGLALGLAAWRAGRRRGAP